MAVLANSKHEHFAQGVAKGLSATRAYTSAGYSSKGATASSTRLLANASVCARIRELQQTLSDEVIVLEISSRNARVHALQDRWDLLRQVQRERAAYYTRTDDEHDSMIAGGTTGLLVKDYKGKDADQPVYKVDTGWLAEIRAHEKQAAEELGQWTEKREFSGETPLTDITIRFVRPGDLPTDPPSA